MPLHIGVDDVALVVLKYPLAQRSGTAEPVGQYRPAPHTKYHGDPAGQKNAPGQLL